WEIFHAGTLHLGLDRDELTRAFAGADHDVEAGPQAGPNRRHRSMIVDGHQVSIVPLRAGTKPVGLLAAAGRPIETGTLDALAGMTAIAIERAQFLEERKLAELARQSEELKS